MKKLIFNVSLVSLFGFALFACGGGGGQSTDTISKNGLSLPTKISAVPSKPTSVAASGKIGFKSKLSLLKVVADPDSDYSKAVTTKFVNEQALDQFDIIEQVLQALAQTNYADVSNIGKGPYKAMIAWQDEQNGVKTKTLEPWVVDSSIILEDGKEVTRARAWIQESTEGGMQLIKAEFKIYAPATRNSDGSYNDYGVWTLNVKFGEDAVSYFAAEASIGINGESIIKLHENFKEGPSFTQEVKAILNKTDTNGFGKVSYPDWESCMSENCTPATVISKYAYNANHLAVQKEGDPAPQFKDRNGVTEMVHQYGFYDSVTGDNILKTKSFGFPVSYTDPNGATRNAYYGAWQGRHELWADGNKLAAGTVVTREDRGGNQIKETYHVSSSFKGTLTKRGLASGNINDVKNIPVETWINNQFMLRWNGSQWLDCKNPDFNNSPATCGSGSGPISDFGFLVMAPNDYRKWVGIHGWDNVNNVSIDYLYQTSGSNGAGFYPATMDQMGNMIVTGPKFSPATNDEIWVDIGGSIYIEYTGTGWVEKQLTSFDKRTWTPVFNNAGNKPYTLELNREYYINNSGANYIVKRTGTDLYDVFVEIQTVANPVNAASFVATGTIFKPQWNDASTSTFTFITDKAHPNFLKLVYKTIGQNDQNLGVSVGDIVTRGEWGLLAFVSGVDSGVQFNWEYPREGEDWGSVTYLQNADNSFLLLDDPIRLAPVTLVNNGGNARTLSLQFDGWLQGLPDYYEDLKRNNFVMDDSIAGKIIKIPEGTLLTDALDANKQYLVKPLEVSQMLNIVSDPGTLDIGIADSVTLASVPVFVEHGMGPMPAVTGVRYSEGILVQ